MPSDAVPRAAGGKEPRLPPDETLGRMEVIAERRLRGVCLRDYCEAAWSEGGGCDRGPLYGPFLRGQGKDNVAVGDW